MIDDKAVRYFKGTSFRVPPDLLKSFRIKCAERGVSQSAVVNASIRAWIATEHGAGPVVVESADTIEHKRWHEILGNAKIRFGAGNHGGSNEQCVHDSSEVEW